MTLTINMMPNVGYDIPSGEGKTSLLIHYFSVQLLSSHQAIYVVRRGNLGSVVSRYFVSEVINQSFGYFETIFVCTRLATCGFYLILLHVVSHLNSV